MPVEKIRDVLASLGLLNISVDRRQLADRVPLGEFARDVRLRHGRSQLLALSDADYQSGLARVEADLQRMGANALLTSEKCDVTITADKP